MTLRDTNGAEIEVGDTITWVKASRKTEFLVTDVQSARGFVRYDGRPFPFQGPYVRLVRKGTKIADADGNTLTVGDTVGAKRPTSFSTDKVINGVFVEGGCKNEHHRGDHVHYASGGWDFAYHLVIRKASTAMPIEFTPEIVIERVFDFSGCDEGKYAILLQMGLDKDSVDAIRHPVRLYKKGDLVKYIGADDCGWYVKTDRVYLVDNNQVGQNVRIVADNGVCSHIPVDRVELFQEAQRD